MAVIVAGVLSVVLLVGSLQQVSVYSRPEMFVGYDLQAQPPVDHPELTNVNDEKAAPNQPEPDRTSTMTTERKQEAGIGSTPYNPDEIVTEETRAEDPTTKKDDMAVVTETQQEERVSEATQTKEDTNDRPSHSLIQPEQEQTEPPQETLATQDPSRTENFSACLFVRGSSKRIHEWLAYHYHTMPLRYLRVSIDPEAKATLEPIFDLFREQLGMNITMGLHTDHGESVRSSPNGTQAQYFGFLKTCLETFREQGHKWTMVYDVDEYLSMERNPPVSPYSSILDGEADLQKAGGLMRYFRAAEKKNVHFDPCIVSPRLLFGARPVPEFMEPTEVPDGLQVNPLQLDTIRWRYMGNKVPGGRPFVDVSRLGPFLPLSVKDSFLINKDLCPLTYTRTGRARSAFRINVYTGSQQARLERERANVTSDVATKEVCVCFVRVCVRVWVCICVNARSSQTDDYPVSKKGHTGCHPHTLSHCSLHRFVRPSFTPILRTRPMLPLGTPKQEWAETARTSRSRDEITYLWLKGFIDSVGLEKANAVLKDTGPPLPAPDEKDETWMFDLNRTRLVSTTDYSSASACIMVRDENHRIREWLAYHYHVLPLKHVIVAVDARAKTSPSEIFDEFREKLGMEITEWNEADFGFKDSLDPDKNTKESLRTKQRKRQRLFLAECLTHLYYRGRSWTACIDPDEFVTVDPSSKFRPAYGDVIGNEGLREGGGITTYLNTISKTNALNRTCVSLARNMVGGKEEEEFTDINQTVPAGFGVDPFQLGTLRFRYRTGRGNILNGMGKPLIDVSSVGPFLPLQVANPHRVVMDVCGLAADGFARKETPLLANHYLGSWEQYSFRDDARRGLDKSREAWEYRSEAGKSLDPITHTWLRGFISSVGEETATSLLNGTGLPRSYKNDNDEEWRVQLDAPILQEFNNGFNAKFIKWVKQKRQREAESASASAAGSSTRI